MPDYPPITDALPSPEMPLIDRHRRIQPPWYTLFAKFAKFFNGLAQGELIVDGAIVTRTLAADSVTSTIIASQAVVADSMAANSITAANAALATASVETLKIAGNAVTQAVSVYDGTQDELSSTTYTTLASTSVTTSGTQPILVWGCLTAGGAYDSGGSGDFQLDGTWWTNNTASTYLSLQAKIGSTTGDELESITVHAAEATSIPFAFLFTGISAATHTVAITGKRTGTDNMGIRDISMSVLETKR